MGERGRKDNLADWLPHLGAAGCRVPFLRSREHDGVSGRGVPLLSRVSRKYLVEKSWAAPLPACWPPVSFSAIGRMLGSRPEATPPAARRSSRTRGRVVGPTRAALSIAMPQFEVGLRSSTGHA